MCTDHTAEAGLYEGAARSACAQEHGSAIFVDDLVVTLVADGALATYLPGIREQYCVGVLCLGRCALHVVQLPSPDLAELRDDEPRGLGSELQKQARERAFEL